MASTDAGGTRLRPVPWPVLPAPHGNVHRVAMSGQEAPVLDNRREAAAREVLAAIAAGEGLVALTGPARVGKTAVLDLVAARLEGAGVRVLRVEGAAAADGRLSLRALLAQVAGRDIEGMEEGAIEELLDVLDGTGAGVVVAVDDAQNLQPDAAEFFRLLAMLGRGQKRRSRVVFAGRPEFWDVFPDDFKGRTRLVGARIALPADEPAGLSELPAAAPVGAAAPARSWRGAVSAGVAAGMAGLLLAGFLLARPRPVAQDVPAAIVAAPVEAPMAGAPAVPVFVERRVEAPVPGDTARRWVAEVRVEIPPGGGVAPRIVAVPQEVPPVGGVAPVRVDPPVEAPVAGRPAGRAPLLVAADLGEAAAVEPFDLSVGAEVREVAVDPVLVAGLMRRGAELVRLGDISAARLAFGRAVAAGEAAAATALGRTYDPGFLAEIGGRGIEGDTAEAARWYRRGAEMGDAAAAALLGR